MNSVEFTHLTVLLQRRTWSSRVWRRSTNYWLEHPIPSTSRTAARPISRPFFSIRQDNSMGLDTGLAASLETLEELSD